MNSNPSARIKKYLKRKQRREPRVFGPPILGVCSITNIIGKADTHSEMGDSVFVQKENLDVIMV